MTSKWYLYIYTPRKIHIAPENDGLVQDDFPFLTGWKTLRFFFLAVNLSGVYISNPIYKLPWQVEFRVRQVDGKAEAVEVVLLKDSHGIPRSWAKSLTIQNCYWDVHDIFANGL